ILQTKAERRGNDTPQARPLGASLFKRWLLGTHAGAAREEHPQAHPAEFALRYKPRKTAGVRRSAARRIAQLVPRRPPTTHQLINETTPCRWFASDYGAAT